MLPSFLTVIDGFGKGQDVGTRNLTRIQFLRICSTEAAMVFFVYVGGSPGAFALSATVLSKLAIFGLGISGFEEYRGALGEGFGCSIRRLLYRFHADDQAARS